MQISLLEFKKGYFYVVSAVAFITTYGPIIRYPKKV